MPVAPIVVGSPVPVMVTVLPPADGPLDGVTPVTVAGAPTL
jgi:hypothetical protein